MKNKVLGCIFLASTVSLSGMYRCFEHLKKRWGCVKAKKKSLVLHARTDIPFESFAFDQDGKEIIARTSKPWNTLVRWDVETGQCLNWKILSKGARLLVHHKGTKSVDSPDGRLTMMYDYGRPESGIVVMQNESKKLH